MRICLVNEYFPPFAPGGAEWSLDTLARALAERGHDVTVITPNYGAAPREERDGVTIVRFPFPIRLPHGRTVVLPRWLANPLFYLYAALAVTRAARAARADVIHVQNKHTLIPGVIAGRLLGIPVFLTIRDGSIIDAAPLCLHHGDQRPADCGVRKLWRECAEEYFALYMRGRRRKLRAKLAFLYFWLDARLKQQFLRRVTTVIGVSQGILDIYRRSGLLDRVRELAVVYNLPPRSVALTSEEIDATRERLGLAGRRVVLYVGKFSPGKGTADLVTASEAVVKEFPDATFAFAGDGTIAGAGPHITVLGPRPNREVLALYPIADVVVVPSVVPEALNRVVLEAMAAGRAVVSTPVGGTPELIVDGKTGLLVERSAPHDLAEAIRTLLRDGELRRELGDNARRRVDELFGQDRSVDRLVDLYTRARERAA